MLTWKTPWGAGLAALLLSMPGAERAVAQGVPTVVAQVQHPVRSVTVLVNGIPVASASPDQSSLLIQVAPFAIDGSNAVEFRWTRRDARPSAFTAAVQRVEDGGLTTLAEVGPVEDDVVGDTVSRTVEVDLALPRPWVWQGLPDVTVDDGVRDAIVQRVRRLHDAYSRGDAGAAVELTSLMWREMSGGREGVLDAIRAQYTQLMGRTGWAVEPLDERSLRLDAFGPLVRVLADDGPLIREESAGEPHLALKGLFYAHVDGIWTVVRPVS